MTSNLEFIVESELDTAIEAVYAVVAALVHGTATLMLPEERSDNVATLAQRIVREIEQECGGIFPRLDAATRYKCAVRLEDLVGKNVRRVTGMKRGTGPLAETRATKVPLA